jgi:hypothetical protein
VPGEWMTFNLTSSTGRTIELTDPTKYGPVRTPCKAMQWCSLHFTRSIALCEGCRDQHVC